MGSLPLFWSSCATLRDSILSSPTPVPTLLEWLLREQRGFGLTASAPVSDVSASACTNGVWPPLRPVSAAQKSKPSTMSSSNVQSIDLPMDCAVWPFWTMRQSNVCSTAAPRSKVRPSCRQQQFAQTTKTLFYALLASHMERYYQQSRNCLSQEICGHV